MLELDHVALDDLVVIGYGSMFSAIFFQIFLRVPIFLRIFAPISNVEL